MEKLLPLLARGGVRAMFSGHEHNFQHSHHDGIDYFVTGAGSKVRKGAPDEFEGAHTVSWSDYAHFLLVTIDGRHDDACGRSASSRTERPRPAAPHARRRAAPAVVRESC